MANELVRLIQGVWEQIPTESENVHFISKDKSPKDNFATYARIVCKIPP